MNVFCVLFEFAAPHAHGIRFFCTLRLTPLVQIRRGVGRRGRKHQRKLTPASVPLNFECLQANVRSGPAFLDNTVTTTFDPMDTPVNSRQKRFGGIGGIYYIAAMAGSSFTSTGSSNPEVYATYNPALTWGCASMDDVQIWTADGSDGSATTAIDGFTAMQVSDNIVADAGTGTPGGYSSTGVVTLDSVFIGSGHNWQWLSTSSYADNVTARIFAQRTIATSATLTAIMESSMTSMLSSECSHICHTQCYQPIGRNVGVQCNSTVCRRILYS